MLGRKTLLPKVVINIKKYALAKHALTVDHRAAIEAKACRQDMHEPWLIHTVIKS